MTENLQLSPRTDAVLQGIGRHFNECLTTTVFRLAESMKRLVVQCSSLLVPFRLLVLSYLLIMDVLTLLLFLALLLVFLSTLVSHISFLSQIKSKSCVMATIRS